MNIIKAIIRETILAPVRIVEGVVEGVSEAAEDFGKIISGEKK